MGPGNYYDQPFDLALDSVGNVLVTGSSYGLGRATITRRSSIRRQALACGRIATGSESGSSLTVDRSGNVYVSGDSQGGVPQHIYRATQ